MTEIARFAENSLFCPFAPFFGETQTRQKKEKGKNMEVILGGFEVMGWHKNLSESLGANRNLSDSLRINRSQSKSI